MTSSVVVDVETFPLSFAQERLWFSEQLDPGTSQFTISSALHVTGRLDQDGLRSALARLISRHEAMRTRFVDRGNGPVQEVLDRIDLPLRVIDLTDRPAALDGILGGHANTAFDLATAPALRIALVQLGSDQSVLLIAMHHIICDGVSAEILLRDLTTFYAAEVGGPAPELPELDIQYGDFARWQRENIDETLIGTQLDFWSHELAGTDGHLTLPADRARPSAPDHIGAIVTQTLPAEQAAALLEAARRESVSPFMLVLAGYELALARASGARDFCIGTTVAGRSLEQVADVFGCFVNVVPIRSDLDSAATADELLQRVRARCLRAYANSDVPFERIVEHVRPPRDPARTPLFDVMLAVQIGRSSPLRVGDVTVRPEPLTPQTAQYDLALDVQIDGTGADLSLGYATALFDESTARNLLERIAQAAQEFLGGTNRPLSGIPTVARPVPAELAARLAAVSGSVLVLVGEEPTTPLESSLLDCFRVSLDRDDFGIHDDFFASGGTSLSAARLVGELGAAVGVPVPVRMLFAHPTVAGLAAAVAETAARADAGTGVYDARRDQVLPPDISPSGQAWTGPARRVLVTGATGFIGAHLVAELVASGSEVVCLARADGDAQAAARVRTTFERYRIDVDPTRISAVAGDLGAPLLGLTERRFLDLGDSVDAIFHSGAIASFGLPYRALAAPNVGGTVEVLRLACTARPSAVHFVSTMDARLGPRLLEEPAPIDEGADEGYVLSKKVAEHLVLEAGRRGLPVGVYRPGLVTASARTGATNLHDQVALCLAGSMIAGVIPDRLPYPLYVLPVDHLARHIVALARTTDPDRPIHQLFNDKTISMDDVQRHLSELGYPLAVRPFDQWRVQVARRSAGSLDELTALLAIDPGAVAFPERIDTANTRRRLGERADEPVFDTSYVRRSLEFLVETGIVPARSAAGAR